MDCVTWFKLILVNGQRTDFQCLEQGILTHEINHFRKNREKKTHFSRKLVKESSKNNQFIINDLKTSIETYVHVYLKTNLDERLQVGAQNILHSSTFSTPAGQISYQIK